MAEAELSSLAVTATAIILLPLVNAIFGFLLPRFARVIALANASAVLALVFVLAMALPASGPFSHHIGGWSTGLGIRLYVDGLAVFMLLATAMTMAAIAIYGVRYFRPDFANPASFWTLLGFMWGGLNALFLSGDVFNLYVTLELIGLAAVALVALAGGSSALVGAMRYLLVTFVASLFYLLGATLLYHQAGTLDLRQLGELLEAGTATWIPLALMTGALILKTALFPLHFWLPPAHANAPAPVSALLSALVIKASFYLLLRLWIEVMPAGKEAFGMMLAILGAAAIVWGALQALRQRHVKLLVAYSTVSQVGYLFLPFAISQPQLAALAWRGALYFVLCHAVAKAAMFMAVGNILRFGGHDDIHQQDYVVQRLPITLAGFGVAGVSIVGLPPSGGFLAKWMLLEASIAAGHMWLVVVILGGGLLASAYIFKVLGLAFTQGHLAHEPRRVPMPMEWICFALAGASLLLGVFALPFLELLEIGDPFRLLNHSTTQANAQAADGGLAP